MNIILLGAAGFIGTNLTMKLAENPENNITIVDRKISFFEAILSKDYENVRIVESPLDETMEFDHLLEGQDVVYHLVSTNIPTTSNQHITQDIQANVLYSSILLEACVRNSVKKVVFLSSGGTVYGKEGECPLSENTPTNPITSYGIQKVTIEKLLYLYHYMYGLDYRIVRLSNPYGPYQRPDGVLGVVTTFTYKAINHEDITVYGDGSVVRDFIYIDDAIRAIINIADGEDRHHTFNVGSGYGTSVREVLELVQNALGCDLKVKYVPGRTVDVPVNYLDISRYERAFGSLNPIPLKEGIIRTAEFMGWNSELMN